MTTKIKNDLMFNLNKTIKLLSKCSEKERLAGIALVRSGDSRSLSLAYGEAIDETDTVIATLDHMVGMDRQSLITIE